MRDAEHERTKHAKPNSRASARRLEDRENTERLIEIAEEEEVLKAQLAAHFDKVNEIQARIESTDRFRALLGGGTVPPGEVRAAARDAARKAAEAAGVDSTPSFFVNGRRVTDRSLGGLEVAIRAAAAAR